MTIFTVKTILIFALLLSYLLTLEFCIVQSFRNVICTHLCLSNVITCVTKAHPPLPSPFSQREAGSHPCYCRCYFVCSCLFSPRTETLAIMTLHHHERKAERRSSRTLIAHAIHSLSRKRRLLA